MTLADVRWIEIDHRDDQRGTLTALEGAALPFSIRRVFYMHRVPPGHDRGEHAHRYTHQCVIALAGSVTIDASDGDSTETFTLDDPNRALYLPPMIWVRLYAFTAGTVTLVLCDRPDRAQDVIRSRDEYLRLRHAPSLA
jgi:hypothetical protein